MLEFIEKHPVSVTIFLSLLGGIGFLVKYKFFSEHKTNSELSQTRLQKEMDYVERQLREFYSPMLGFLKDIRAKSDLRLKINKAQDEAWREKCDNAPKPFLEHEREFKPYEKSIEYDNEQLRELLLPSYSKMLEIFKNNYGLAEKETEKWYSELSDFVELWDRWMARSIPAEVIKKLDHSEAKLQPFYDELEKRHEYLKEKLLNLNKQRTKKSSLTQGKEKRVTG